MREITIFDTKTGKAQNLKPRGGEPVGIYACGPTVYSRIHVGNARPYVVCMLLKRFLEFEGYEVKFAANITDINDKIYAAARAAGVNSEALAAEMIQHYIADTDRLGIGRPDLEPLASETLGPIIELIEVLINGGHAYEVDGDVYFKVRSLSSYGDLSHRDIEQMDQGEGNDGVERKQDPLDFALWKAQKPDEDAAWPSPWGLGRPGWHIECSAMGEQALGLELDIHGGGTDLIFPHHENEAAQTLAARGRDLVRIWMHNGMIELGSEDGELDNELSSGQSGISVLGNSNADSNSESDSNAENTERTKMSKSLGNIRGLGEVLDAVGRDTLLLYFCSGRYRQPLAFSRERLTAAARSVSRIREVARRVKPGESPPELAHLRDAFFTALANDFNTPTALASLYDWISEANKLEKGIGDSHLREMLWVFGLDNLLAAEDGPPDEIAQMARLRDEARSQRNFSEADRLRDELLANGWEIRDTAGGSELVRVSK